MASKTTYTRGTRVYLQAKANCAGFSSAYHYNVVRGVKVESYNLPDHRPKPKPAWKYPTATAIQSTYMQSYGLDASAWRTSKRKCGDIVYRYVNNLGVSPQQGAGINWDRSDWALDMRAEIKDLKGTNLAGYIGEYKETCSMVAELGYVIADVHRMARFKSPKYSTLFSKEFRSLKKSKVKGYSLIEKMSSLWLLNSFAVQPVLSDVNDIVTRVGEALHNNVPIRRMRSYTNNQINWSRPGYDANRRGQFTSKTNCVIALSNDAVDRVVQSGNVAEAIWEGIGFSFVVDYFFNVGDVLSSMDALDNISLAAPHGTVTETVRWSETIRSNLSPGHYSSSPCRLTYKSHRRRLFTIHQLGQIKAPQYKPTESIGALRNASALLGVLFGKELRARR